MATPRAPSACVPGSGHNSYPFCNSTLPLDARVRDLVRRIKDEDKPKLLTARAEHGGEYALSFELGDGATSERVSVCPKAK